MAKPGDGQTRIGAHLERLGRSGGPGAGGHTGELSASGRFSCRAVRPGTVHGRSDGAQLIVGSLMRLAGPLIRPPMKKGAAPRRESAPRSAMRRTVILVAA